MPVFSQALARRRARKAQEAALQNPESVLGPPPAAPASALATESAARASSALASSAQRRRAARPVNAITARPAVGAQTNIRAAVPAPRKPATGRY